MLRRVENPPNRYHSQTLEWLDLPPELTSEVYEEKAKSILTENKSPDLSFRYSINPYRGCFHACAYCYARPSHQYLDFGSGTDFERKLIVKVNAAELLEQKLRSRNWKGELIVFSGNTDCYQPLEATYCLTRRCLELMLRYSNPAALITKGALIRRDIDVLSELQQIAGVKVIFSIAFLDDAVSRRIEPHAPRPSLRFRAMSELSAAGVPVGLALAPIIPGLNDEQIPGIIEKAAQCGADSAFSTLIRLPAEVQNVFEERLRTTFPSRAEKVLGSIRAMKGGALNRSGFGQRMTGTGARWEAVRWLFEESCRKHGLRVNRDEEFESIRPKTKPKLKQLDLFS